MNTATAAPTIGPYTSNLLRSLQAYEQAISYYYQAVYSIRNSGCIPGEERGLTEEENAAFEKGRQLLEGAIMAEIYGWANSTDPNCEI